MEACNACLNAIDKLGHETGHVYQDISLWPPDEIACTPIAPLYMHSRAPKNVGWPASQPDKQLLNQN